MSEVVGEINDAEFEKEVLQSALPVLVDFWAVWCGPCLRIAPMVEELAGEYAGKVTFMKMNVDDNPSTPAKYGIRSIPTLIIFKGGDVSSQIVGVAAKSKIESALQKAL